MKSGDISLKTHDEVAQIRAAARVVARVFEAVAPHVTKGVRPADLDRLCGDVIRASGANASMRGYDGFPTASSISVNSVAVHGVPDHSVLQPGDIVTVDVAVERSGWNADGAWTFLVPGGALHEAERRKRLVEVAWQASLIAVAMSRPPNTVGDLGERVSRHVARCGFVTIPRFSGHGIGASLHEEPTFHYASGGKPGKHIVPGLVFTVEPVIGTTTEIVPTSDGYGYRTADGSPVAQFEHTVAVSSRGTEILTMPKVDLTRFTRRPPDLGERGADPGSS